MSHHFNGIFRTFRKVTAILDDSIEFKDKMLIFANNGNVTEVFLHAIGTGTTIVTIPTMNPIPQTGLDLGSRFTTQEIRKEIKFVNRGRRPHRLNWHVGGFERLSQRMLNDQRQYEQLLKSKDVRFKNLPPPTPPATSVFTLTEWSLTLNLEKRKV